MLQAGTLYLLKATQIYHIKVSSSFGLKYSDVYSSSDPCTDLSRHLTRSYSDPESFRVVSYLDQLAFEFTNMIIDDVPLSSECPDSPVTTADILGI
jgi:hypothetical protein